MLFRSKHCTADLYCTFPFRKIPAQILHGNPILRLCIKKIQHNYKKIFQRLHDKIYKVRHPAAPDMPGNGVAITVIEIPQSPMRSRHPLCQQVLECVGHQKLPVHHDPMPMAHSRPKGPDHLRVSSCGHRTQVMLIIKYIGRRLLKRQRPVAGLRPRLNQAVRLLTEQDQDRGQHTQQRPHEQKCKSGKTAGPLLLHAYLPHSLSEYQKQIEQAEISLYGSRRILLPAPQCVVFYNGEKDAPEEEILKLSDAFINKAQDAAVELRVRMLNINYGYNGVLMERCHVLEEYAQFVEISRQYMNGDMPVKDALECAIQYCIEHGILYDILRNHRAEVLGMLLEEFDVDKYERPIRMEGVEEGIERSNRLTRILIEQNRMKDMERAIQDPDYQKKLFREFDV